jgi:hypothetical protein
MKPITKQLTIATFILASVTVLSFGIRHVRFSVYRADIVESTPSVRPSDLKDQSQPEKHLDVKAESEYYWEDSYIADTEPDPQDTKESFWDEQALADEYAEAKTDSGKKDKAAFKTKSFKSSYVKSGGKKGPQEISLGDNANIYITEKGEAWFVSEQPDGKTTKMQVQIDGYTGDFIAVGDGYSSKQGPQRISMSDSEDIYLTDEGEAWYVSEEPDGPDIKVQLQPD